MKTEQNGRNFVVSNTTSIRKRRRRKKASSSTPLVFVLERNFVTSLTIIILVLWLFGGGASLLLPSPLHEHEQQNEDTFSYKKNKINSQQLQQQAPRLLSSSDTTTVTASVRGNLGPPSVVLNSGQDWLKDRWQAASDMHGTAIKGSHWIELTFDREIYVTKVVLDWEAAYAKNYRIEGRKLLQSKTSHKSDTSSTSSTSNVVEESWNILYDGADSASKKEKQKLIHIEEYGQSPGVKTKTPLHIVHTIDCSTTSTSLVEGQKKNNEDIDAIQILLIFIRRGAMGWGVSLWHIDVYGVIA